MKSSTPLALFVLTVWILLNSAFAADGTFTSLEDFCNSTKADTPKNCACGQAKADELLTPDEQQLVIGMMTRDPSAMKKLMELGPKSGIIMHKVEQITKGCDD